jgi:uroporphyrinogen-III synthase
MKQEHSQSPLVVLTREAENNASLRKLLEEKGVQSISLPCIAHAAAEGLSFLPGAIKEHWDYVVVTSPHAANVLIKVWQEMGTPTLTVACVGKGTKAALVAGGMEVEFVPSKASAAVLVAELPERLAAREGGCPLRILYPTSALASSIIEDGLNEKVGTTIFICTAHM